MSVRTEKSLHKKDNPVMSVSNIGSSAHLAPICLLKINDLISTASRAIDFYIIGTNGLK